MSTCVKQVTTHCVQVHMYIPTYIRTYIQYSTYVHTYVGSQGCVYASRHVRHVQMYICKYMCKYEQMYILKILVHTDTHCIVNLRGSVALLTFQINSSQKSPNTDD